MSETSQSPATKGVHHVGLTVPDVEAAAIFFTASLGMNEVARRPEYPAIFVSDGAVMITLWQAAEPDNATPFDRKRNVGLHHLALAVENTEALAALHERLAKTAGVEIEFAPEPVGAIPFHHMMFSGPGGVRLELIAPS
jgi:catechol 2,3-dioxygenase-like lactoylglutathione lyase family enzyme